MPRGQTAHLEGKRTGRPRGTAKRSRLLADLQWAYETIAEPDARPPTGAARWCKDLAARDQAGFLALLGSLEAAEHGETVPHGPERRSIPGATLTDSELGKYQRRLKGVTISESRALYCIKAKEQGTAWAFVPPWDAHVVGCEVDTSKRTIRFFLHSEDFPELQDDEPIKELDTKLVAL